MVSALDMLSPRLRFILMFPDEQTSSPYAHRLSTEKNDPGLHAKMREIYRFQRSSRKRQSPDFFPVDNAARTQLGNLRLSVT
jgi:hypothetical protein